MDHQEIFMCYAISSSLSSIGSLFIIIVFFIYPELQIFAFRLIRDLAVLDLFHSLAWILPPYYYVTCQIQAVTLTIVSPASVLWTSVIALTLHMKVLRFREINESRFLRRARIAVAVFSLLCFLVSFLMNSISHSPYGKMGGWCWIDAQNILGRVCRWLVFYVPMLFVLIYNSGVNFALMKRIKREFYLIENDNKRRIKLVLRLWVYPLILIVCYIPATTLRIYFWIEGYYPNTWVVIAGMAASSNGFFNAVAYGFNKAVRKCILRSFRNRSYSERCISIATPDVQLSDRMEE